MSVYKELSYADVEVDIVKGIQFSVMSPEDIERRSVAEINKTDTYNGNDPVPHGLFDPRMGVIDYNKLCVTCGQRNTFCPGHFGHIKLEKPVFYVQFFPMVRSLLKCVCYRCSKLLIDPEAEEALQGKKGGSRQKRFETVYKLCQRVKRCGQFTPDGCGAKQPTIAKEGMLKLAFEWKDGAAATAVNAAAANNADDAASVDGGESKGASTSSSSTSAAPCTKQVVTAEEVLKILRRISDKDAEVLGLSKRMRPEHLICTVLPVPPPTVRPSVRNDTGQRSEDDLTHKLSMIIKVNNNLKKQVQKGAHDQVAMIAMLLQYEVATFIDNTIPGMPPSQQRTGRPIRSLTERLKGKEGRIRGNLMGKRVDFSARSVITPDPTISIDELGVPQKIAMNLTFPEIAHALNIERLRAAVLNGPDVYPGAKYVRKTSEGRTIRLQSIDRTTVSLELGDVVDRHLQDGDVVLFNRQPSLHKCSMMAHRVKVMPGSTFRLNVMVTPCFNADFDGDEMNMHVPQSLQTHEELLQLAAVPTQIVSQRECKPIVSVVQDIVTGLFRLTKDSTTLTEKQMANLLAPNPRFDGVVPMPIAVPGLGRLWSGRQLLSTVVPPRINVDMKTGQYDENKSAEHNAQAVVAIRNGQILSGAFDKDVYQARTKGLVHSIFNEYGPDEARVFLDNTQKIICNFLVLNGFSVGISDLVVDAGTQAKFLESIRDMKTEVYKVLAQVQQGRFENKSTKSNAEAYERQVNDLLNRAVQSIGKQGAQQLDDERNRMINMIRSKAKGNNINVSQMIGCLGQQNVDGKRIADNWEHRTLPHFCKFDDGPESRGFVESSFIKGLTPQEFYFHAMGGREGIIDTAVQTSETGYIQRKLVKAMEDCKVNYDGSVRNAAGAIVQFLYGDDGMDGAKVEAQTVPYLTCEYDQFLRDYDMCEDMAVKEDAALLERMRAHVEQLKEDRQFMIQKIFHGAQDSNVMAPVSFFRLINMAKGDMAAKGDVAAKGDMAANAHKATALTPEYVLDALDGLAKDLYVTQAQPGNQVFLILARAYLSPKVVIHKHKLSREALDYVIQHVRQRYQASLAHPSELVGVVAATSIGEPSTQLVLNSVEYDTGLVLRINGELKRVKIGEFIDGHIDNTLKGGNAERAARDLEQHPNDTWLGWLRDELDGKVEVLSCDKDGKIAWSRVEAVTKHPVVNKDGSDMLLKVTLRSGRTVTATKAKSFLKRVNNEIVGMDGEDLRVGDYLPVSRVFPVDKEHEITHMDLGKYLDKREFLFMSEVAKAKEIELNNHRRWWKGRQGIDYVVPYSRGDAFRETHINGEKKQTYEPGCVYPKNSICVKAHIPERIPLDEDFGFFVGAFLAEGHATTQHVLIANVNTYLERIKVFGDKYNIKYHIKTRHINNGVSTTLRMHSSVLATFMRTTFGELAHLKRMPAELYAAPKPFLRELLNGYFSGDGCVANQTPYISADSASQLLLEGIQQVLLRFDIVAPATKAKDTRTCFKSELKQMYHLRISAGNTVRFAQQVPLVIKYKQERADVIVSKYADAIGERTRLQMTTYGKQDVVPDIVLSTGVITAHRDRIPELLAKVKCSEDAEVLRKVLEEEQIMYDEVVTIEEVRSERPYVYDLTVEGTRNFNTADGLCAQDTFHSVKWAGIAAASKTVRGVPRLKELLGVSKKIKTPCMKVYFGEAHRGDRNVCRDLMNDIRIVRFKDLVLTSRIYFDPEDGLEADAGFLSLFKEFEAETSALASALAPAATSAAPNAWSAWVLRITLDRAAMYRYHMTMIGLHNKLLDAFASEGITCTFSDDNAEELVLRVRLATRGPEDDMLTETKALEHTLVDGLVLKGTDNIEQACLAKDEKRVYDPHAHTWRNEEEWVAVTEGTNLRDLLCLPHVDATRTTTNNIVEIYEVFGIEAVRQALFNELAEVLDSIYVNYRHLSMLVDVQTNKGYVQSIDRHGINRGDIGPLAKCSFEETTDKLVKAGIFAEQDKINGVSANIMLGQIPPAGTGDCEVLMDTSMLVRDAPLELDDAATTGDAHVDELDVDQFRIMFQKPEFSFDSKQQPVQRVRNVVIGL